MAGVLGSLPASATQALLEFRKSFTLHSGLRTPALVSAQKRFHALFARNAHPFDDARAGTTDGFADLPKSVLTAKSQAQRLEPLHLPLTAPLLEPLLNLWGKFRPV
jgi:hypothetical protein